MVHLESSPYHDAIVEYNVKEEYEIDYQWEVTQIDKIFGSLLK